MDGGRAWLAILQQLISSYKEKFTEFLNSLLKSKQRKVEVIPVKPEQGGNEPISSGKLMAIPKRCTVTIDGNKFNALAGSFKMSSKTDISNLPKMGSMQAQLWVFVDMHDTTNMPYSTLQTLFNLANVVSNQKFKQMQIAYWKDDTGENALAEIKFKGWVGSFETSNLNADTIDDSVVHQEEREVYTSSASLMVNNLLALRLNVLLDSQNASAFQIGN